jgi:gliding motility-associated-like protein
MNFAATGVGFNFVTMGWTDLENPVGTQYRLERSLDGTSFTTVTLLTGLAYTDSGLTELTSYYYRLRGINGDGISTSPTAVITAFTPKQKDFVQPEAPAGLKGLLDPTGHAFTLIWDDVSRNTDGTTITDLAGYNIYRRTSLASPSTKVTPIAIKVTAFADQVDNRTFYYTIRAVDKSGNESADSLIADSSPESNILYIAPDGVSLVQMPQSVNDLLRSAYNKYGVPLTIALSEEPLSADGSIVRSVRLKLMRTDNKQVLSDLAFAQPHAVVRVGYNAVGGQIARGEPIPPLKAAQTPTQVTGYAPDQLSLYWFNGVTWVKVGGTLDVGSQALQIKSSFLGNYQIRGVAGATSLSLSQGNVYPRLFTPNGDGLNDRVYFVMENPKNASVSGEIMDRDGRHVRTLPPAANQTGIGTTLTWDGKDDSGNVVPGGAYLYKITGEGKSFTGTVGVAR